MQLLLDRRYLLALPFTVALAAVAIGLPTDVLPNPWFKRMTPVEDLDIVFWVTMSLSIGALAATLVFGLRTGSSASGTAAGSSVVGTLAVGCPVCNKLVVAALGTSGALSYFAAIQPALGAAGLIVTLWALRRRLRSLEGCAVAPGALTPEASGA